MRVLNKRQAARLPRLALAEILYPRLRRSQAMQPTVAGTGAAAATAVGTAVATSFRMSLNSNPRKAAAFLHLHRHQNRTKAAGKMARACAKVAGCCCCCCWGETGSIRESCDELSLHRALSCHIYRQALLFSPSGSLCRHLPRVEVLFPSFPKSTLHGTTLPQGRKWTTTVFWCLHWARG